MKKYLLVSLTILFAAAFLWAADATEPSADIEADATLSWGIDIGKGGALKQGFKNEASWAVKFPLIKKADSTSTKSDVPVYGEITLKDMELNLVSTKDIGGRFAVDGKVDDLEAKLVMYGAYLTVFNKPDFNANHAQIWKPADINAQYVASDYRFRGTFSGYGTKIGYANKDLMDLDVSVKFGSSSNWKPNDASETYTMKYFDGDTELDSSEYIMVKETTTMAVKVSDEEYKKAPAASQVPGMPGYIMKEVEVGVWKNGDQIRFPDAGYYAFKTANDADKTTYQYAAGFDLSIKPLDKMLAIAMSVNSTFTTVYPDANLNFGVGLTSEPIDGLKFTAGFDGMYDLKSTFDWDTVFTAQYKWIGAGVYAASAGTSFGGYDAKTNTRGKTDLAVFAQFATKGNKDDATNLVNGLDAGLYIGMYQMLAQFANGKIPLFAKVWGAYKANINDSMWIQPFTHVWFETYRKDSKDLALAFDVGVKYSPVEKVEVQAKWNSGKISKNVYGPVIKTSVLAGEHIGCFVLSLKVSY